MNSSTKSRGVIAWMVANPVVANLLMIALIGGGLLMATRIKKEVFPDFELDLVTVSIAYPGASPEEIERGIVTAVENAIRGLNGIEEVTARATEGSAAISIELASDADRSQTFQDIRQAVDRIRTFPENAENPQVSLATRKREVLQVVLYGDADESSLREIAETVRDRLLETDGISQIDVLSQRSFEVHVELEQDQLREYNITHSDVAASIRNASVELPGGQIRTVSSDVLIRVSDRKEYARDIRDIVVLKSDDGGLVRVGDIAKVAEGFSEEERYSHYNGKPSVVLAVYRVGDQTPVGVADTVRKELGSIEADLAAGIEWTIENDRSQHYRDRLTLLLKNAAMGLILVMGLLAVFLDVRLAFWVTMGIPTSFLGSLLILAALGISINIISMFAFIIALGIVVDDAIVAGENIYENRQRGMSFPRAAIHGAQEVGGAIGFAICTNIITFLPLAFVPGTIGKIWKVIPFVVIATFLISWIESLLILPSHLAHEYKTTRLERWMDKARVACSAGLSWYTRRLYAPVLRFTLRWRMATVAACLACVLLTWAFATSGRIGWILMPRVESDMAAVTAVFPDGTPQAKVSAARVQLVEAAQEIASNNPGLVTGVEARTEGKSVEVFAHLSDPAIRPMNTAAVTKLWRSTTGDVTGAKYVRFESDRGGPGSGAGVTLEISHNNPEMLELAALDLAERLQAFPAVQNIDDGTASGVEQLNAKLSPAGDSLGLNSTELARQIRSNFFGTEALRYQRGRHEVRVLVRRPESGRDSRDDIESILVQTPSQTQVPLREVATVETGTAYTVINRRDAKRTLTLRANVSPIGETSKILDSLRAEILPSVQADYPGLHYSFQGRQRSFAESLNALLSGLLLSVIAMYFLLAMAFKSYLQPLVVMAALPLGAVGAVMGHWLLGFNLSILSMMGFIALAGVLVNDAIVLVTFANQLVKEGVSPHDAIEQAAQRRLRAVLLTTLTTFGGLAPMIFETSRAARFMIPMAISLGFGILLATAVTLILVPSLYSLLADGKRLFGAKAT